MGISLIQSEVTYHFEVSIHDVYTYMYKCVCHAQVNITDGSLLPVRLAAYWKCTEKVTNFRFDYTYIGANLPSSSRPPLTQMSVCVPVNGGVRNTLSRPSGNWVADKQQITWKIGEVAPGESDGGSIPNHPTPPFLVPLSSSPL